MGTDFHSDGDPCSPASPISPGENALPGLAALLRAYSYARDTGADLWDFALEIDALYAIGLTVSDLRWLVARHYAEHGNERSAAGDPHRSFESSPGFNFEARTCLVLTADGATFAFRFAAASHENASAGEYPPAARDAAETEGGSENSPRPAGEANLLPPAMKPRWAAAQRELYFGEELVKRFRVPARNQELILEVFEEDDWPEFIDDPLPQSRDICPKTRLRDAIHRLNGHQTRPLLRFHGNGNGMGVYWEVLPPNAVGVV